MSEEKVINSFTPQTNGVSTENEPEKQILNAQGVTRNVESYASTGTLTQENDAMAEDIKKLNKQLRNYRILTAVLFGLCVITLVARLIAA